MLGVYQTVCTRYDCIAVNGLCYPGEHRAYLSHTEGPNEIYIQLSADSARLTQITENLQAAGANADPEVYCPQGHSCMALYSADNAWYR